MAKKLSELSVVTAITADDRLVMNDGSTTKTVTPDAIVDYVGTVAHVPSDLTITDHTVGASPFGEQLEADDEPRVFYVSGGAGVVHRKGPDSLTLTQVMAGSGTVVVYPGEYYQVTWTSAPTAIKSHPGVAAFGQPGADGAGVATGGTTGQVLAKASDTDHDTEWVDASSGSGVTQPTGGLLVARQFYNDASAARMTWSGLEAADFIVLWVGNATSLGEPTNAEPGDLLINTGAPG